MALIDLANYDIFDLLMTSIYTDEQKGKYIYNYMLAFAGFLSKSVADRLTESDEEEMRKLLADPNITPEAIENFYKDRIPNYDSYLLTGTLLFKKNFLLHFYNGMLEKTKTQNDPSTLLWSQIVAAASGDNWKEVYETIKKIEEKFVKVPVSPLPRAS